MCLERDVIVNGNPYYNNTGVVLQGLEMQGVGADYNGAHSINQGEDEDLSNFDVGYNPYEIVDRKVLCKKTMTLTPNVSSTLASATMVDDVYECCCGQKQEEEGKEEDRR